MSLKGSLQTAALPEVLQFLSSTGKSGELHVSGTNGEGRLWFDEGRIAGFDSARAVEPHEAIFELMRINDGEFSFSAEAERSTEMHAVAPEAGAMEPALEAAEARMAEWRQIVEVVPSLAHRVTLRADGPTRKIVLEPQQWATVVVIGDGRTVGSVIDEREMQEFDGCRAIKDLVDASLVEVAAPAVLEGEPVVEEVPASEEPVQVEEAVVDEGRVVDAEPLFDEEPMVDDEPVLPGSMLRFGVAAPVEEADSSVSEEPGAVSGLSDEDHYAALRAAIVEVGENLVDEPAPAKETAGSVPVYEFETEGPTDSRAALEALLNEVTTPETGAEVNGSESVDGLADRGPWTDDELSTMDHESGWKTPEAEPSNIVPFVPAHAGSEAEADAFEGEGAVAESDESAEDEEEAPPVEEPINRGLLLKFLSSVRN